MLRRAITQAMTDWMRRYGTPGALPPVPAAIRTMSTRPPKPGVAQQPSSSSRGWAGAREAQAAHTAVTEQHAQAAGSWAEQAMHAIDGSIARAHDALPEPIRHGLDAVEAGRERAAGAVGDAWNWAGDRIDHAATAADGVARRAGTAVDGAATRAVAAGTDAVRRHLGEGAADAFKAGADALHGEVRAGVEFQYGVAEGVLSEGASMESGAGHLAGEAYTLETDPAARERAAGAVAREAIRLEEDPTGQAASIAGAACHAGAGWVQGAKEASAHGGLPEYLGRGAGHAVGVAATVIAPEALAGKLGETASVAGRMGETTRVAGRTEEAVSAAAKTEEEAAAERTAEGMRAATKPSNARVPRDQPGQPAPVEASATAEPARNGPGTPLDDTPPASESGSGARPGKGQSRDTAPGNAPSAIDGLDEAPHGGTPNDAQPRSAPSNNAPPEPPRQGGPASQPPRGGPSGPGEVGPPNGGSGGGAPRPPASQPVKPQVSSEDIAAYRKRIRVPKTDTVGVARTNVPGLDGELFEGGSTLVRREAGLPPTPDGPIASPAQNPMFRNHAEQDIANKFVAAVEKAGLTPDQIEGRELLMRIQNDKGICNTCRQGLKNPSKPPGVLKQLSLRYPGLDIRVVVDNPGPKLMGPAEFTLRNGSYVE